MIYKQYNYFVGTISFTVAILAQGSSEILRADRMDFEVDSCACATVQDVDLVEEGKQLNDALQKAEAQYLQLIKAIQDRKKIMIKFCMMIGRPIDCEFLPGYELSEGYENPWKVYYMSNTIERNENVITWLDDLGYENPWEVYDQMKIAFTKNTEDMGKCIDEIATTVYLPDSQTTSLDSALLTTTPFPEILEGHYKNPRLLENNLSTFANLIKRIPVILNLKEMMVEIIDTIEEALEELETSVELMKKSITRGYKLTNFDENKLLKKMWEEGSRLKKHYSYYKNNKLDVREKVLMKLHNCASKKVKDAVLQHDTFRETMKLISIYQDKLEQSVSELEQYKINIPPYWDAYRDKSYHKIIMSISDYSRNLELEWETIQKMPQGVMLKFRQMRVMKMRDNLADAKKNLRFLKTAEEDTVKSMLRCEMNIDTEFDGFISFAENLFRKMRVDEYKKRTAFYERRISFCIPISEEKMFWIIHDAMNALWCC